MIKKSLSLKETPFATLSLDLDAILKVHPINDTLPKIKLWNQADLAYFDSHFNRAYGKDEIVAVGKNVYYRNVILFV